MGLSRIEQETIINFNAEEDLATVWAADPVWIRKFDKLVENNPDEFKCTKEIKMDGTIVQKRYEMPKKLITIRSKTRKLDLSDEERQNISNRMRRINSE